MKNNEEKDIIQLWASGTHEQIVNLTILLLPQLSLFGVSRLASDKESAWLELSFLSANGFQKAIFKQITDQILNNYGLTIRIAADELNLGYNKEFHYKNGAWDFAKTMEWLQKNIPNTKPLPPKNLDENKLSPKERIRKMLLNYGTTKLELDEPLATSDGYISEVYTEIVEYTTGLSEDYENLNDDTLEDLEMAVEMQIEANQKVFDKSQGL